MFSPSSAESTEIAGVIAPSGWDHGTTAGTFSFGFVTSALVTPCVGRLMDRRGPSLVVELGVAAMAAGLLLAP
jgi:MFS family permease